MKLDRILPYAKKLLEMTITNGDVVVDATLGNGHDTLFMANLVGEKGTVYGFDVQEDAIRTSMERLNQHGLADTVTIFHKGHEHLSKLIPAEHHGKVKAAIFNLGYLPGSDKSVVTKPETTITAIQQLLEIMVPEGLIILVIYHGHAEGAVERDALLTYCQNIDQKKAHVLQYRFINQQNNPPFIVAIEKR
ncbi:tRNA A58 N-methylase Trm61 [Neobacillus niacini]|uniref:class I SAM-dependent methyltransferase n=1 Tax=Neobacillus niacini TaxID=86668 RepID=UPI00277DD6D5|nr:class I SAM-dependent methyltransferase [Neobacillus niacini]MDQ1001146.1 tRNA A58 N-methylase Trm61 [Neobacillus niacini]